MAAAYRTLLRSARWALPRMAPPTSKLGRGVSARSDSGARLIAWADHAREPDAPLVWLHAPSLGESIQADSVARALSDVVPEVQIAFTYFSPSAEAYARTMAVDVAAPLPWDLPEVVEPVVEALRPAALLFVKTEVWPELSDAARAYGASTGIVAASVPPGAGRRRWPTRRLLGPAWAAMDVACVAYDEDERGLVELGVRPAAIESVGDPAVDAALARLAAVDPEAPHLAAFAGSGRPTLVAGSTWPEDERHLIRALRVVRVEQPGLRVVLAPHEPTPARVEALIGTFRKAGWRAGPLSEPVSGDRRPDVVVVDTVGALAELYTLADVAYVGGGFGRTGLHNVLEPAAAGVPTLVGPRIGRSAAARALVAEGGAKIASDSKEIASSLARLLDGPAAGEMGRRALDFVGRHRGAALRTARCLEALVH